ncbi:MAG: MAPEG family protein, partial [Albidovulum sp.]
MSSELNILALYGLYTALVLLAQVTGAQSQLGMGYLLSSRDEHRTLTGITARLDRALTNSITAMALFAPAILLLHAKGGFTHSTLTAAQV